MSRKQYKNDRREKKSPDLQVEYVPVDDPEKKAGKGAEELSFPLRRGIKILEFILVASFLFLSCLALRACMPRRPYRETAIPEDTEMTYVTEAGRDPEDEQIQPETKDNDEKAPPEEAVPETEDTSWQEKIFGKEENTLIAAPIKVKGLTENEKNLTGFRESDFIRGASSFLTGNNIHVSGITFDGNIAFSSGDATAYTAKLDGISDVRLIVIFFPSFPGKYLFALENIPKEKEKAKETEAAETSAAARPQVNETPAATRPQMESAPVNAPQTESAASYDAMSLHVNSMPEEMENYLANSYELQYELYDYLYQHGVKNAREAKVTDYYIDSDERTAVVQITVEGSGNVTALYDRDSNSYSFQ